MSLPKIGESLDPSSKLENRAKGEKAGYKDVCGSCKTSPYPRGFIISLKLCWFCGLERK